MNNNHLNRIQPTASRRFADKITKIIGSWVFLFFLTIFLIIWISLNIFGLIFGQWDPYPFVFLNLTLACLTTYIGPIILMSQNRAEERDREKIDRDYAVNRKSEREVENMQQDLDDIKKLIKDHHLWLKGEHKKLRDDIAKRSKK